MKVAGRKADHRRQQNGSSMSSVGQVVGSLSIVALLIFVVTKLVSRQQRNRMLDGRGYGVLITGCDSGFGHQLARCLDQKGFVVFAGCLFPDGNGAQTLTKHSTSNLKVLRLDVTSDADVEEARKAVLQNLPEKGTFFFLAHCKITVSSCLFRSHVFDIVYPLNHGSGLWAVVNNAGISQWAEIEWSTIKDFSYMVDINLFGSIRTTLAFLPLVRASKGPSRFQLLPAVVLLGMLSTGFVLLCRSDGLHLQHLLLLHMPEHGCLQCVQERPGGFCRLSEGGDGEFWSKGIRRRFCSASCTCHF